MFDKKKVCKNCGWTKKYDSDRDTFNIELYQYCPICGKRLKKEYYSPDI